MKTVLNKILFLSVFALLLTINTSQIIRNNGIFISQPVQPVAPQPLYFQTIPTNATSSDPINKISTLIDNQASTLETLDAQKAYAAQKIDTYNLATTVFNSQSYLGALCDRCKKLQYFAFTYGGYYVTARPTQITFEAGTSPNNNQLFIGYQQVDGTWAFQSLTEGKYLRASNDGVTINYQTYVGPWERWYMERHGNHCHIQSGQFQDYYWIFNGGVVQQLYGGASMLIIQHWPKINWGWNW